MAKPTATSAAATAMMKNTNTCPDASPLYDENAVSSKFTEFSINSTDINTIIAFLLMRTPVMPTQNIARQRNM